MRYLSVCSGIEAATCAWHPLGWEPFAFSEIEKFPSAVLAHHYPNVPNLGDMTKFKEWPDAAIDVLVGGTPCQSFSVAGLRKGLADPRGNLMLTYGAIAAKYRPAWLVWENVPGVLSSNGGRDFGTFLGMLAELGYGFAYRVLDAQFFGVAQRRRRVFVVGYLGNWRRAAAVLFERHSLSGHPAPSRQAGQGTAGTFKACASSGGWSNSADHAAAGYMIPVSETLCVATGQAGAEIGAEIAPTLNCNHEAPYAMYPTAHSLRGEGFDASEDGTGRGTPLVPVGVTIHGTDKTARVASYTDVAGALRARTPGSQENSSTTVVQCPVPHEPIAFPWQQGGTLGMSGTLVKNQTMAVAFTCSEQANGFAWERDHAPCLTAQQPSDTSNIQTGVRIGMQVRRLTPIECERLQGFPDNYTQVPHRNKPAADGPRYKALGNSMAVPVMRWIGERIQMVEAIEAGKETKCA